MTVCPTVRSLLLPNIRLSGKWTTFLKKDIHTAPMPLGIRGNTPKDLLTTIFAIIGIKDDFVQGRAQCLVEIEACLWNNRHEGVETDLYGIVSNGQVWQFYCRLRSGEIHETELFNTNYLPELLSVLDFVCAECSRNTMIAPTS